MKNQQFNYSFVCTYVAREPSQGKRLPQGTSIEGKRTFSFVHAEPLGGMYNLAMPRPATHAQKEQLVGQEASYESDKSLIDKAKGCP
jgi:hypothetical protein